MAGSRTLSTRTKRQVEELFEQGVTEVAEVCDRLDNKLSRQQVGGLLTLWRRRLAGQGAFPTPPAPSPSAPSPAPPEPAKAEGDPAKATAAAPPSQDPFDFGHAPPAGAKGDAFGFGAPSVEYHVRRTGPTLIGFLGVEVDPFDHAALGHKYGSGQYQLIKYVNGQRTGYPANVVIADTFGAPRNPRPAGGYPRLRPHDWTEDPEGRDRERPRQGEEGRGGRGPAQELNETVQAVKQIHDMVRSDAPPKPDASQTPVDSLLTFFQQQQVKAEADRTAERERFERERGAERERREAEAKERASREAAARTEAEARHAREMEKAQKDHEFRMAEAERQAKEREAEAQRRTDEREKADRASREHQEKMDLQQRQFLEKLDKDREQRLEKAVEEAHGAAAAVQMTMKEERERDRTHERELAELRSRELENERERIKSDLQLQREHLQQMYDLQLKAIPAGANDGTKMICDVIKDAVGKADEHAKTIEEIRKTKELVAALGPEQARQLAQQLLVGGGVDLGRVLPGQRAAAAPGAPSGSAPANGTAAAAQPGGNGKAADTKGDGMNGIAQQVIETPFFKDLLEIWGGQLRMKRTPFLFVDQLCGYMLEDRRVQLFYNYMASKPWEEFWPEIKPKAESAMVQYFETPEAETFFSQVVDLIAQRVERDHIDRGIVPPGKAQQPAPAGEAVKT